MNNNNKPDAKKKKAFKVKTYQVPDGEKYIVVVDPPRSSANTREYYDMLKSWLRTIYITTPYDSREPEVVRAIWGVPNNPRWVVVELNPSLDISSLLGAHFPREFLGNDTIPANTATLIFEYNFALCGHPGTIKQWPEFSPEISSTPPLVRPYPRAHYCKPPKPPTSLPPLALPLPPTRGPTPPPPSPEPITEQPPPQEEIKLESLKVKKLDPYEEDEAAFSLLRSNLSVKFEPSDPSVKPEPSGPSISVKLEPREIKPEPFDQTLAQTLALNVSNDNMRKQEYRDDNAIAFKTEDQVHDLERAFAARQARTAATTPVSVSSAPVKSEPGLKSPPLDLKRKDFEDPGSSSDHRVKDETREETLAFDQQRGRNSKRIKAENMF